MGGGAAGAIGAIGGATGAVGALGGGAVGGGTGLLSTTTTLGAGVVRARPPEFVSVDVVVFHSALAMSSISAC